MNDMSVGKESRDLCLKCRISCAKDPKKKDEKKITEKKKKARDGK